MSKEFVLFVILLFQGAHISLRYSYKITLNSSKHNISMFSKFLNFHEKKEVADYL